MATTIDTDLLLDTLSDKALTYLGHVLAPITAYSTDFTANYLPQTKAVQVPVVTGGSAALKNPTDFESGTATTTNIAVTVDHYSAPFDLSSCQINNRFSIETLAEAKLNLLAEAIAGVIAPLFNSTNFPGTGVTVAQSSFAAANAKTLLGALGKNPRKSLLLDSVAFAQLAPENKNAFQLGEAGAYGFAGVYQQTYWTGAESKVYGVACGPAAVAIAAGIPIMAPKGADQMLQQKIITIPGIGLSVQLNSWFSTKSRSQWASYDIMFGAAAGLSDAAVLIKAP